MTRWVVIVVDYDYPGGWHQFDTLWESVHNACEWAAFNALEDAADNVASTYTVVEVTL